MYLQSELFDGLLNLFLVQFEGLYGLLAHGLEHVQRLHGPLLPALFVKSSVVFAHSSVQVVVVAGTHPISTLCSRENWFRDVIVDSITDVAFYRRRGFEMSTIAATKEKGAWRCLLFVSPSRRPPPAAGEPSRCSQRTA